MVNHNLYITFLYIYIVPVDEITVLIGAAVPAERNMETKSSEYVITAPFCVHKQNFVNGSLGLLSSLHRFLKGQK